MIRDVQVTHGRVKIVATGGSVIKGVTVGAAPRPKVTLVEAIVIPIAVALVVAIIQHFL